MPNPNYNFECQIGKSKIGFIIFIVAQILVLVQLVRLFLSNVSEWLLIYMVVFWVVCSWWIIVRHVLRIHFGCVEKIKVTNGEIYVALKQNNSIWHKITVTTNTKVYRHAIVLSYTLENTKLFKYLYLYSDMLSFDEHRRLRTILKLYK